MKKVFLFAMFCGVVLSFGSLTGAEQKSALPASEKNALNQDVEGLQPKDKWTIFQLGFFPSFPSYTYNSNVYGIKTGWPICSGIGRVQGLEASWLYSGTNYIRGAQGSIVSSFCWRVEGTQAAILMCMNAQKVDGIQASCIFNLANDVKGLQAGGLNIVRHISGFQPGVLGNFAIDVNGFQAGLFNVTETLNGAQASAVNVAKDAGDGFQFGVVNVAKGKGTQLGLINIISGGKVPFLPFFNISR